MAVDRSAPARLRPPRHRQPLLAGGGVLLGPELFTAAADLRADPNERTMVMAANRLLLAALAVLAVGSVLSLAGVIEPTDLLLGIGGP